MMLSEDQLAIKRMVADFAKSELADKAFKPESEEDYRARQRKLAGQGLLGMTAPVEHGGGGLSYFDALLAVEEMAKYDPRSAGEMHTNGTGTASHLWVLGTPEQQERWLRPICEGRMRCAIAMTEPEAGSAATEMTTTAMLTPDGQAYCLNGGKIFISGGKRADVFITYARFVSDAPSGDEGAHTIGAIVIEKYTPGFSILRNDHNMADEDQAQLLFEDCRVPVENVLVTGNAFGRLIRIYNRNRLSGVAQALGMATASYEDALRHVQVRRQFGRELADFPGLQWMLADMAIQLNACRATLYQAASALQDGELDPLQVSMAKVFIAETCVRVCDMAIQLFGGYGYMADAPVNHRYRRVRGTLIYGGTMQIHRNMVAARILGRKNNQRRPQ
jgi:alkylation response protein AidB-like acyl-CoA dehydrogenase